MRVIVVVRQLEGHAPVVSAVLEPPQDEVIAVESYLTELANGHIRRVKEDFPEFSKATWTVALTETRPY